MDMKSIVRVTEYVKENEENVVNMLCALWKLVECHNNEEKEKEVFAEHKLCFGTAADYVCYALDMKHICSSREYRNLLQNRLQIVATENDWYLYNMLFGCLCEWEESGSRRRVARFFLSCIPSDYMERIWRKAGAKLNDIPEAEVVAEMIWKYPRSASFDEVVMGRILHDMIDDPEDDLERDAEETEEEPDENYVKLRKSLDDIHPSEDELVIAYREVLETLSTEELEQVVDKMDVFELGWCIVHAEGKVRIVVLNSIKDPSFRMSCLRESINIGQNAPKFVALRNMPMKFFEKCNEVRNSMNEMKE